MKNSKTLKIGLIGAWAGICRSSYIPAIKKNPRLKIAAVMDVDKKNINELAKQFDCDGYTDAGEIYARDDIDVISITSPDFLHCEQTVEAADAGKHIICTKPIALSIKEACKMRSAVKKNGVIFMAGMNTRYLGWCQAVKRALEANHIGKPVFVRWIWKGGFYAYPKDSFYREAESGGQLVHNGAHYFDAMSYWVDSLPSRIYGVSTRNYAEDDRMAFDNYQNISLRYESGALGHLEHNQMLVNPRGYPAAVMITVVGTEGMVEISVDDRRSVELYSNGKISYPQPIYSKVDNSGFDGLINDFTDAVLNKKPSPIPIEHSIRILEACLKGVESCNKHKPLALTA